ncbi:MAG: glycerophosphodiester phosphodiesterase family protein [Alphaproteobacteria bacterium]|nr:glycerophosphodiester phosphodiesterase family protein [Alphaproteobacteria bacterium]
MTSSRKAPRTDVPRIIGHRGTAGNAPENTIAGFEKAQALGARWVEFDCMLSLDEVVVLHHDDTVDRTTNGTGLVSEKSFVELRRLDAGSWFSPDYTGAHIPSFDQTIAALTQLGLGANVEIKPVTGHERRTGQVVAAQTAALWPVSLPPALLSSFSLEALEEAMTVAPDVDRAILWWDIPKDWYDHHIRLGASAAHVSAKKLSDRQAAAFREAGVPFRAYTVNDPAEAERLYALGCESIFTDFPDRFS